MKWAGIVSIWDNRPVQIRTWFPQSRHPDALCELANFAPTSDMSARSGEGTRVRSPSPWPDTWRLVEILSGSTQRPVTSLCLLMTTVTMCGTSGASSLAHPRLDPIFASCAHTQTNVSPGIEPGGLHLCGKDLGQMIASHFSTPKRGPHDPRGRGKTSDAVRAVVTTFPCKANSSRSHTRSSRGSCVVVVVFIGTQI